MSGWPSGKASVCKTDKSGSTPLPDSLPLWCNGLSISEHGSDGQGSSPCRGTNIYVNVAERLRHNTVDVVYVSSSLTIHPNYGKVA